MKKYILLFGIFLMLFASCDLAELKNEIIEEFKENRTDTPEISDLDLQIYNTELDDFITTNYFKNGDDFCIKYHVDDRNKDVETVEIAIFKDGVMYRGPLVVELHEDVEKYEKFTIRNYFVLDGYDEWQYQIIIFVTDKEGNVSNTLYRYFTILKS